MVFETMRISRILAIISSIVLTFIILIFYPHIYAAIIAGLPLFRFKNRQAMMIGFLIGIVANFAVLFALYSPEVIMNLANLLSYLSGLPSIVLLIFYPIIFSIVLGISATIFAEINRRIKRG
jgi:hypothetical protein